MCLTATYSGIDRNCTLSFARLGQGKVYIMAASQSSSVLIFKNRTLPAPSILTSTNETVYGVWNTTAGGNSNPSSSGTNVGNYNPGDDPVNVFDNSTDTKYANYGACSSSYGNNVLKCGENTGLYLSLIRGPSLLVAFIIATADNHVNRDPITVTIEGSNQNISLLTLGSTWILIYNGSTGLDIDPGGGAFGVTQWLPSNSIWYLSYRMLITSKRDVGNYVHYSEVQLLGY